MAAWVEVETTVAEAWSILDVAALCHPLHAAYLGSALNLSWQQLHEALHSIESTLAGLCLDDYTLVGNGKAVAFLSHLHRRRNLDRDVSLLSAYGYIITGSCLQLISHVFGNVLAVSSLIRDGHFLWQHELALLNLSLYWHRNNIDVSSHSRC